MRPAPGEKCGLADSHLQPCHLPLHLSLENTPCRQPMHSTILTLPPFLSLMALCLLWPRVLPAPSQAVSDRDYRLVVDVDLVTVLASVTTAEGALAAGLTRNDFQLFEDGVPQEIALFGRQSDQALRLHLLFDSSLSITTELGSQQEAAIDFLRLVVNRRDRVSILQVSENVVELVRETSRPEAMARALRSIRPGGGTSLYDAVYLASQGLSLSQGRKVILIISDGTDTTSKASMEECLQRVLASEAVVYALVVQPIKSEAGRNLAGERSMIYLTRETGGRFFPVASPETLRESFARIGEELRTQYLLGYYPRHKGEPGKFRRDPDRGGLGRSRGESAKRLFCAVRAAPSPKKKSTNGHERKKSYPRRGTKDPEGPLRGWRRLKRDPPKVGKGEKISTRGVTVSVKRIKE